MTRAEIGGIAVDQTLPGLLDDAAANWPDRVFLHMDGESTTFSDFRKQVACLASGLADRGVGPDSRLSVLMRNSKACVLTWFAANWLGAAWVPINTEWRGRGLENAVRLAAPTLLIADADLYAPLAAAFDGEPPVPVCTAPMGAGASGTAADLSALIHREPTAPVAQESPRTAGMLYTSGTTGRSKACAVSHRYFVSQAAIAVRDFGLRRSDVLYCPFPLFHADATALTVVPALLMGATAAIGRRFSASRFWDEVRATGATVFDFMGATLSILHKAERRADDADNPARLAWGVPVPEWVGEFEQRFGLTVLELYGSVEANIPVTQKFDAPRVPGSCGTPTPEFDIRVADANGDPVPPGVVGELLVRPRIPGTILDGYFGDAEATAKAFSHLWFHSGDLVKADEADNIFFVGRGKDAIRRRGENISALEVEEGVEAHPDVLECAAVGVPSDLTEEEVKVFVVKRPGSPLDAESIWTHCAATMARFQVPRYISFVDSLPKTPTGKVSKLRLMEMMADAPTWDREQVVSSETDEPLPAGRTTCGRHAHATLPDRRRSTHE
ncbi:AMP-binding protein [Nonomuraea lactucae]|uniref:AMP-binding protein n=1 Tax=Nonomuraea lactucae TaxID=2249762 RepID=UPI000DE369C7|nr:AMP-binding protein [Nonomuraea lactucae]